MGTLSSELAQHAQRLSSRPRIYADANVPAGLVAHMRLRLQWDVLFVVEEDALRRAPDAKHYRLAQQLGRTLVILAVTAGILSLRGEWARLRSRRSTSSAWRW